ncbi:MAG: hypothetical protein LBK58_00095 [Prevotellaceae bacterium]|jgi:hypothetical protein|nr:hypothetical protein [Prevotellaceae bacterium]
MRKKLIYRTIRLLMTGMASCKKATYWKHALLCLALTGTATGIEVRVKTAINENIFTKFQIKQNGNNRI